jgi:hypothetical protein
MGKHSWSKITLLREIAIVGLNCTKKDGTNVLLFVPGGQ